MQDTSESMETCQSWNTSKCENVTEMKDIRNEFNEVGDKSGN